ncbi:MAG: uvrD [Cytophagaceae bacterium]|jgi:DNA helicase-2/ATP-dependent DNA helicase PcrA|nr:uvrD [Cytophagaceae bacterium]
MQAKQHNEQIFTSILAKLNPEQRQAVETTYGPVLVLAGPGTGKTQVLSARIGQLLSNSDLQVNPSNILCLTFTDAGTIAMRNRLLRFMGPMAYKVSIHTFHSFCNEVITYNRHYFSKGELQPVSELETMQYYQELYRSIPSDSIIRELKDDAEKYAIKSLKQLFDTMKKEYLTHEGIERAAKDYIHGLPLDEKYIYKKSGKGYTKGDLKIKLIQEEELKMNKLVEAASYYQTYQDFLLHKGRYDFNDMILWVLNAFKTYKDLLYNYQERFQYILVDEYQDTSNAQNEILNELSSYDDAPNIFVVGDDDQSIYRFQGASMKNIVSYVDQYSADLTRIVMKSNYRSTQKILDAAKSLIECNKERLIDRLPGLDKNLVASADGIADLPGLPQVKEYRNVFHEEASVIAELEGLYQQTGDLSKIAVIYRSHAIVERMVSALEQKNIPLNLKKAINVLEVPFIRQLLSMLKYVYEEAEKPYSADHELFKILHYPVFGITALDAAKITTVANYEKSIRLVIANAKDLTDIRVSDVKAVSHLSSLVENWVKQYYINTPQVLFEMILNESGMMNALLKGQDHNWNIQVLSSFFDLLKEDSDKQKNYSVKEFFYTLNAMDRYSLTLPLYKSTVSSKGVHFLTAHASKGLEFDAVYLIGCTQHNWEKSRQQNKGYVFPPTLLSADNDHEDIEEERRLFYVGMTRAVEKLHISYAVQDSKGKETQASQFIAEVRGAVEFIEVKEGDEDGVALYRLNSNLKNNSQVKLEVMDTDKIRQDLEGYKLSVTHLNKYLNCPISFYFENILRVPSSRNSYSGFGSAVHLAMQFYFEELLADPDKNNPSKEVLLAHFEKGMNKYHSHFTKDQYDNMLQHGKKVLSENYDQNIETWKQQSRDIIIEQRFDNIEVEAVPVTGMIDKMERGDKNLVQVIDYKTGNPANGLKKVHGPSDKDPNGGDYWRQMVFYKLLLDNHQRQPFVFESGRFDFLEPDKKSGEYISYKVPVTPQDEAILKGQIKEVYRNILDLKFDVGCGDKDCTWCNFVKENYKEGELSLLSSEE